MSGEGLAVVAAVAENGVIGRDGDLPWRLPEDLKHFKRITLGHTLLMGRRTWESIGRPLPGRRTLVLSRSRGFRAPGAEVVESLAAALELAGGEQLFAVGGAEVYRRTLPLARRLYLTRVHAEVPGDTRFPELDWSHWRKVEERHVEADARHAHPFTFEVYERRTAVPDQPSPGSSPAFSSASGC